MSAHANAVSSPLLFAADVPSGASTSKASPSKQSLSARLIGWIMAPPPPAPNRDTFGIELDRRMLGQ